MAFLIFLPNFFCHMMIFQSFSDDVLDFEKASNMPKKKLGKNEGKNVKGGKNLKKIRPRGDSNS